MGFSERLFPAGNSAVKAQVWIVMLSTSFANSALSWVARRAIDATNLVPKGSSNNILSFSTAHASRPAALHPRCTRVAPALFIAETSEPIVAVGGIDEVGEITLDHVHLDFRFRGVSKKLLGKVRVRTAK